MPGILDIIGGPVTALINGAKVLIGQKLSNDKDKIETMAKLDELTVDLQKAMLDADAKFVAAQQAVIVAETQADSFLTKNWRPIAMMFFLVMIGFAVFNAGEVPWNHKIIPEDLIHEAFSLVKLGLGGYVGARTVEKVVPTAIKMWKNGGGK